MPFLRNWFRPKDQIRPVSFSRKYEIANFSAKHFFSIFRKGLLRLSAGTYEATFSTAANLVSHLNDFDLRPFSLVMFGKRFSLV